MRTVAERRITGAIFLAFLVCGAMAMMTAYLMLGRVIIDAGAGEVGAPFVIVVGALVGTLTAFIIHEVGTVLPGVMSQLKRGH